MTTQQPSPKRRLRPAQSDPRVFTRTSSEQAGERYGIEHDTTWKVFGVGARIRQNVTTGYQTQPTFNQPPTYTRGPELDFGEADFLRPAALGVGGSSASSSDSITAPDASVGAGAGAGAGGGAGGGYFPKGTREFNRFQSTPNFQPFQHDPSHTATVAGFQSDRQTRDKAHWTIEQEKLEVMVRRLKPRVRGELRGMADVFVEGQGGGEVGQEQEDGFDLVEEMGFGNRGDEFGPSRGTKRQGASHGRSVSGSGGISGSSSIPMEGDEDEGMASGTDTDEPSFPPPHPSHGEFGTPGFIRSRKGGLRPTKSLPARSLAFTAPSLQVGEREGPMAAPFTTGFFRPHRSSASGMSVEHPDNDDEEEEDGFDMDEAFGQDGGDVFGGTIGGSMDVADEGAGGGIGAGLGEWVNRTDF